MSSGNGILVGIDFSTCSKAALRRALQIGARFDASVTALHVVAAPTPPSRGPLGPLSPGFDLPTESELVQAAQRRWLEFRAGIDGGKTVHFVIEVGNPRDQILDAVRRERPRLLLVGAHGRDDGFMGIGSVASACVQRAATEVLVVREDQGEPFQSVVACVDFSDGSLGVLEAAASIAAEEHAELHIVHVYTDPWRGLMPPDRVRPSVESLRARQGQMIEQRLREFCSSHSKAVGALDPAFHGVLAKSHGEGINAFIAEHGCDLAVLGTRGRFSLRDYFWGSTAERVVREAKCSVLTVKPPGFVEPEAYSTFADATVARSPA